MPADPLSDVLRSVHLTGAVFFVIDCYPPFVAEAPRASAIAHRVIPGAQHVIEYHAVTHGACWGGVVGERPVRLETSDMIVFPQGDAHVVSSAPGLRAHVPTEMFERRPDAQLPFLFSTGELGPDRVELVCGFFGCDARPFNPLLATLPRVVHVRGGGTDGRLWQLMQLALAESRQKRMGGESMLGRVSELMFVEVVRRHLESLPQEQTGWLAGLRDDFVGRALALLHGEPARPWSLDDLARRVALSRSALSERFTHLVGQPPMQYLARWRMQLAAGMLRNASSSVAAVASETGYASEAAFSRAFKKLVGVPPAAWRRQATARAEATAPPPPPVSRRSEARAPSARRAPAVARPGADGSGSPARP